MENRAKHAGGRPRKEIDLGELKRLLDEGHSIRRIATDLRCGYGTVRRRPWAMAEMSQNSPK